MLRLFSHALHGDTTAQAKMDRPGIVSSESVGGQGIWSDVEMLQHEEARLAKHAGKVVYQEVQRGGEQNVCSCWWCVEAVVWLCCFLNFRLDMPPPARAGRGGEAPQRTPSSHCQGRHGGHAGWCVLDAFAEFLTVCAHRNTPLLCTRRVLRITVVRMGAKCSRYASLDVLSKQPTINKRWSRFSRHAIKSRSLKW